MTTPIHSCRYDTTVRCITCKSEQDQSPQPRQPPPNHPNNTKLIIAINNLARKIDSLVSAITGLIIAMIFLFVLRGCK